ncbi:ABC transporter substrate-binding protein [Ensifer sp. ENS07]|uniref:ABC transporter substrate-binding protein n=1 Tax=Ensifer sp. ENS07 TaxID=2769274 RepID=UPI00177DB87D|nr:ABC transporter substrate-binding protein [Ensifer sp. ENS07]MBD9641782.1 ABC transporter substrate-binding protein [Ensifer sp. ENS07]
MNADFHLSRRQLLQATAAVATTSLIWGSDVAFAAPTKGGTLRVGWGEVQAGEKLDPISAKNGASMPLVWTIFEPLVRRKPDFTLEPCLAESWEYDAKALEWTFKLRQGVKFHDGTEFGADDVFYTLSRHMDPAAGSAMHSRYVQSFDFSGVTAPDAHTIKIKLKKPDTLLPFGFTSWYASIVKKGTVPTTEVETAIGTGPFKLVSFEPGQSWEATRNDDYWNKDVVYLDGIQCIGIPDQNAKIEAVLSGAVDVVDRINPAKAKELVGNSEVRLMPQRDYVAMLINHDASQKPFNDQRVRAAMKLAVDRQMILDTAFYGLGSTTPDVPVPQSDASYPPDMPVNKPDIAKAKALLAEAGYSDGFAYDVYTSPAFPGMVDLAVIFAENMKAIGITVNVIQWPVETYWDQVDMKMPSYVSILGRRLAHDALDVGYAKGGIYNGSKFDSDGKLRELITEAMGEPDQSKQKEMYAAALRRVGEESAQIIPVYAHQNYLVHRSVEGTIFVVDEPASLAPLSKKA